MKPVEANKFSNSAPAKFAMSSSPKAAADSKGAARIGMTRRKRATMQNVMGVAIFVR